MNKIIAFMTVCMFCTVIVAADVGKVEKEQCPDRTQMLEQYVFINKSLQSSDNPLSALSCKSYANLIKNLLKEYPFIEASTEIDKSWFEKSIQFLDYIGECKVFIVRMKDARKDNTTEYRKVEGNLQEATKRFAELLEKPTPVEQKKLEKLREEKRKWELTHKREKAKSGGIKEDD